MASFKRIKTELLRAFGHLVLIVFALILGQNSYKEFMREFYSPLTRAARNAISAEFPFAVAVFVFLYCVFIFRKKDGFFLGLKRYAGLVACYVLILNVDMASKGASVLIALNLSAVYLSLFLALSWLAVEFLKLDRASLPQITGHEIKAGLIDRFFAAQAALPGIKGLVLKAGLAEKVFAAQAFVKGKNSAVFALIAVILFWLCAALSVASPRRNPEHIVNLAYFFLSAAAIAEIYGLLRPRVRDEKKD